MKEFNYERTYGILIKPKITLKDLKNIKNKHVYGKLLFEHTLKTITNKDVYLIYCIEYDWQLFWFARLKLTKGLTKTEELSIIEELHDTLH